LGSQFSCSEPPTQLAVAREANSLLASATLSKFDLLTRRRGSRVLVNDIRAVSAYTAKLHHGFTAGRGACSPTADAALPLQRGAAVVARHDEAEAGMESPSSVQFAQKAAIVDGTRILMVRKSSADPHNPELWELPGGRMHFGEDVEQHLSREIREEVGLEVQAGRPVHIWSWIMQGENEAQIQVVAVVRICTITSGHISCDSQDTSDHISSVQWHDFASLDSLRVIASQRAAIQLAMKETVEGQPDFRRMCQLQS